ncbi:uncharacterized protein LOC105019859 isoform X3 [Esox lucius]|uniref:uncharacterized protein LOC105019859 isoform X3 n=1 Tax=Esox lucius TaxID=8010 RepID=UPI001477856E|nr:uncharacterized protein LOC105019859 isoform X3 [Esox lucius]
MSFLTMKTSCMFSRMYPLLISSALAVMVYLIITLPSRSQPGKHKPHSQLYPFNTSSQSITPVYGTRHFMVGAYKEYRVTGRSVRIISIFRRDSVEPLYCVFYCGADWAKTGMEAEVQVHSDHFGFPFGTTDVLCPHPPGCHPTHVTLSKQADAQYAQNHTFLRIQNLLKRDEEETFPLNFTVCVSNLFGDYNNVLQFAQTLEMYKLLNVQRVVVYKTSCGPDLERLLRSYTDDGFLEAGVFLIENHIFPKSQFEPSGRFDRLSWRDIPGINIMQHIYREEPDYRIYHPSKMIIRPRTVEQTSVHSVLRNFGETINVPPQLCHIIHVRVPLQNGLSKEELHEDKRIWDYEKQLVPNVDKALERAGFLTTG